ncbi:MAG TPA: guanylate kinase [Puia sp.]|nr:guanylate kinase [Puia sp.]
MNPIETGSGKVIIITAPSGAGKTSITHYLLDRMPELDFSVSATTRARRSYETERKDYYFLSIESFKEKIQNHEFVEWEMVYEGKYYGTLKSELERIWQNNKTPVLDIDVQGAIHVQQRLPRRSLSIFVEPPSITELRRRLESRGTETPETLQARLNKASFELSFRDQFDRVIVNDDLDRARLQAEQMIREFLSSK